MSRCWRRQGFFPTRWTAVIVVVSAALLLIPVIASAGTMTHPRQIVIGSVTASSGNINSVSQANNGVRVKGLIQAYAKGNNCPIQPESPPERKFKTLTLIVVEENEWSLRNLTTGVVNPSRTALPSSDVPTAPSPNATGVCTSTALIADLRNFDFSLNTRNLPLDGTQYELIFFMTDTGGGSAQASVFFKMAKSVNLRAGNVRANGALTAGQNITFSGDVTNNGSADIRGTFSNRFQVDENSNRFVNADRNLGVPSITDLNAGQTKSVTSSAYRLPDGTHTVRLCADSGGDVGESDESTADNCEDLTITVAGLPDLVPTNLTWTPLSIVEGDEVFFTTSYRNGGDAAAGSFNVRWWIQGTQWVDVQRQGSGMAPGATSQRTSGRPWVAERGTNILVNSCLDGAGSGAGEVAESDENNNCIQQRLSVSGLPNLDVTAGPSLRSGTLQSGSTVTFDGTVTNIGPTRANETFANRFRVDVDRNGSWDVTLAPNPSISGLSPSVSQTVVSGPWASIPQGSHRVELCADQPSPVVRESDENNNCETADITVARGDTSPTASSFSVTSPANFCSPRPPQYQFSWTYNDANADRETSYRFQVDTNTAFSSPDIDRAVSGINEPAGSQNNQTALVTTPSQSDRLNYGTAYFWRVDVCNANACSGFTRAPSSFTTPANEYPNPTFTWSPASPAEGSSVQFTDQTAFFDAPGGDQWSWSFPDGNPTASTAQNPSTTFGGEGGKAVRLTATDRSNFSCSVTQTVVVSEGESTAPIPRFREISPMSGVLDAFRRLASLVTRLF